MVKTKRLALWSGILLGGAHLIWALCIWIIPTGLQNALNRIFDIHLMQAYRIITQFDFGKMLMLVALTFIAGWIIGRITGLILNDVMKKK